MITLRNKKNYLLIILNTLSYLELCKPKIFVSYRVKLFSLNNILFSKLISNIYNKGENLMGSGSKLGLIDALSQNRCFLPRMLCQQHWYDSLRCLVKLAPDTFRVFKEI